MVANMKRNVLEVVTMANEGNLRTLTSEEAREIGRKGGIASGKARAARKTLKEELLALLEQGDTQERISLALLQKAMQGDTKAFEVLRDTVGEKPTDKIEADVKNEVNINIELSDE
jgi:hypothetical protein